jgi:hypothetical protein
VGGWWGEAVRREGGGREEGARWRGREAAEEKGEEGCAWWRSGGGGLGLVESIYTNITKECRPSDRDIDGSQRPRCWWADV